MQYPKIALGVGLMLTFVAALGAEQRGTATLAPPPPTGLSPGLSFAASWRPAGSEGTKVVGSVIDSRQTPVAKVKVRLRNISTGEVMAEVESNENGEYAFPEVEPGTYLVEMFIDGRYVVALSNAGSVARNETLQTVVQLAGRWDSATQAVITPQNAFNFVGLSATTTMAAATMTAAMTERIAPSQQGVSVSTSSVGR